MSFSEKSRGGGADTFASIQYRRADNRQQREACLPAVGVYYARWWERVYDVRGRVSVQRTHFRSWDEEREHREKRLRKLERIQGLQALLDEWEKHEIDSDEAQEYLRELRQKLHSARTQFKCMKP